mmetsp:Transcript_12926/g.34421  ORF Transcript_12926/g.34421 Transcript_12926/m.34421 type:complete len:245 (+) Transcript_12926:141-875(+)
MATRRALGLAHLAHAARTLHGAIRTRLPRRLRVTFLVGRQRGVAMRRSAAAAAEAVGAQRERGARHTRRAGGADCDCARECAQPDHADAYQLVHQSEARATRPLTVRRAARLSWPRCPSRSVPHPLPAHRLPSQPPPDPPPPPLRRRRARRRAARPCARVDRSRSSHLILALVLLVLVGVVDRVHLGTLGARRVALVDIVVLVLIVLWLVVRLLVGVKLLLALLQHCRELLDLALGVGLELGEL